MKRHKTKHKPRGIARMEGTRANAAPRKPTPASVQRVPVPKPPPFASPLFPPASHPLEEENAIFAPQGGYAFPRADPHFSSPPPPSQLLPPAFSSASDVWDIDYPPQRLERAWTFWVHLSAKKTDSDANPPPSAADSYESTRQPLHSPPIDIAQTFWKHFTNIPAPSSFFASTNGGRARPRRIMVAGKKMRAEGWSFFEAGLAPDWEDPRNQAGAVIRFRGSLAPHDLDRVWLYALLALVGETAAHSERIVGLRFIDRGHHRLEVWLDSDSTCLIYAVRTWFSDNIVDGLGMRVGVHIPSIPEGDLALAPPSRPRAPDPLPLPRPCSSPSPSSSPSRNARGREAGIAPPPGLGSTGAGTPPRTSPRRSGGEERKSPSGESGRVPTSLPRSPMPTAGYRIDPPHEEANGAEKSVARGRNASPSAPLPAPPPRRPSAARGGKRKRGKAGRSKRPGG